MSYGVFRTRWDRAVYLRPWWVPTVTPPAVTSLGGLHHIVEGMGDTGVGVVPQTLHTIEAGVAA